MLEPMFENRWADQIVFSAAAVLFGNEQICFHDMFQDLDRLFVHKKRGFEDSGLLGRCSSEGDEVLMEGWLDDYPGH